MKVLGVHIGHNSTAAILIRGRIVACVSEERFTRIKNQGGIPIRSIRYVLHNAGIKPENLDLIVISSLANAPHVTYEFKKGRRSIFREALWKVYKEFFTKYKTTDRLIKCNKISVAIQQKLWQTLDNVLSDMLGVDKSKIIHAEHHLLHAYSVLYSSPVRDEEALIFTCDGEGDFLSATVNIFDGDKIRRVSKTLYTDSLGWLWYETTKYLGMKPNEHEYKVMGLAPYAPVSGLENCYKKFFADLIEVNDDLSFNSKINLSYSYPRLKKQLEGFRFDYIAGALQKLTEELLSRWISKAIDRYKIHTALFSGGVFLNIKANMKIALLDKLRKCYFMPSGGDESLAIGCAYFGAKFLDPSADLEPIKTLYLGPSFDDTHIEDALESSGSKLYTYTKYNDIEDVIAELLTKGKIVARFKDRMEWGARALGNRSILADASDFSTVKIINDMIKQRDFWMPFAPTILDDFSPQYIKEPSPEKVNGQYMIIGFMTTEQAKNDLKAAMHPYDLTIRPQILPRDHNPAYYKLIVSFYERTGRPAILNTSFNLHGEPIVCNVHDAINTFLKSGLEYMALGNYLVTKNKR